MSKRGGGAVGSKARGFVPTREGEVFGYGSHYRDADETGTAAVTPAPPLAVLGSKAASCACVCVCVCAHVCWQPRPSCPSRYRGDDNRTEVCWEGEGEDPGARARAGFALPWRQRSTDSDPGHRAPAASARRRAVQSRRLEPRRNRRHQYRGSSAAQRARLQ